MGIYISNMEMPLLKTELIVFPSGAVQVYDSHESYLGKAQAVPLPEGHGRLIDADALWESYWNATNEEVNVGSLISCADTIIPAEGGENE